MSSIVEESLLLTAQIRAVDLADAVTLVLNAHFLPDLMGNLKSFATQKFRCKKCGDVLPATPDRRAVHRGAPGPPHRVAASSSRRSSRGRSASTSASPSGSRRPPGVTPYVRQRIQILESSLETMFPRDALPEPARGVRAPGADLRDRGSRTRPRGTTRPPNRQIPRGRSRRRRACRVVWTILLAFEAKDVGSNLPTVAAPTGARLPPSPSRRRRSGPSGLPEVAGRRGLGALLLFRLSSASTTSSERSALIGMSRIRPFSSFILPSSSSAIELSPPIETSPRNVPLEIRVSASLPAERTLTFEPTVRMIDGFFGVGDVAHGLPPALDFRPHAERAMTLGRSHPRSIKPCK